MQQPDRYALTHRALQAMHAPELPVVDPHEQHAVEVAVIIDKAMDEATENFKKLDTDTRGLARAKHS